MQKWIQIIVISFLACVITIPTSALPQSLNINLPLKKSIQSKKLSSIIQAILDSVNIDQIYLTERHLTGEESFLNNGVADSIMTRYSDSPDIFKAEDYIVSSLENSGLPVELQEFLPTTFFDIQFTSDHFNSAWLVSNDRIYGRNNQLETWSVQNAETAEAAIESVLPMSHKTDNAVDDGLETVNEFSDWAVGNGIVDKSVDFENNWQKVQNMTDGYLNNIIALKQGTTFPDQYYIICAHYDSRSSTPMVRAPGADDNGSGTAAVLEAARVLADYDFKYSIKFVLFPAEEQGLIGSRVFANAALVNGDQILGVINLDMIGYDGNNDGSMEIHAGTMGASQAIANFVNANITNWGLPLIPELLTSYSSISSDHSSFWNAGYPAILIIEDFSDFTPDYHKTSDLLSTLRPDYFLANAQLAIGSLALLAEIDSLSSSISADDQIPKDFILYNPYPNPFNPTVHIEYFLPSSEKVAVEIYNLSGQSIKELVNQREDLGPHRTIWDGTTSLGEFAASGIYFVRLQSLSRVQTKKIILIR